MNVCMFRQHASTTYDRKNICMLDFHYACLFICTV